MCGRINLRATPGELAEFFELFREPVWERPRFNLGPMQNILAIRQMPDGVRVAEPLQWGLVPNWAKDASIGSKMINARSDTVATKPAFRTAFRERRCIIPASGFYEWQIVNSNTKQPWHIFRSDGKLLAFAGLWEFWQTPEGHILESCSIITTDANRFTAEFHDRMPVILAKGEWSKWLDPSYNYPVALTKLLVPSPDDWLEKTAVSTFVNSVKNDSPECIRPVKPERTLF
jgi:putative SOS response-associated peptidase YedK